MVVANLLNRKLARFLCPVGLSQRSICLDESAPIFGRHNQPKLAFAHNCSRIPLRREENRATLPNASYSFVGTLSVIREFFSAT